jgi:ABC-type polysaccharide/polyol phosphate export permease
MKVQTPNYLVYVLAGILPWAFFSQSVLEGMEALVANESLITKIPMPLHILTFVSNITNMVTLLAGAPVIFLISLLHGIPCGFHTFFVFYFFACLILISYSLGMFLSFFYVLFRDLKHVMNLFLQLWMFATPVVYPLSLLSERHRFFLHFNPVADIIGGLHAIFSEGIMPTREMVLFSGLWALFFSVLGKMAFRSSLVRVVERL